MRVSCPDCEVSLLVPGALASGGGFDDLFDEPGADSSDVVAGPGTVSTTQPDLDIEEQPLQLEEDPVIAFAESSQVPVPEQGEQGGTAPYPFHFPYWGGDAWGW